MFLAAGNSFHQYISEVYDDLRLVTLSGGKMAYSPYSYGGLGSNNIAPT
jgi:hypothetical protein